VNCLSYSPNGCYIVTGSLDTTIRIWDAETGDAVGKPLEGHTDSVESVAYSPDGRHIISGSGDNTIRIWNAETGSAVGKPLEGHIDRVASVAYSPDGRRIISGSGANTIRIWNAETGSAVGKPLEGHIPFNCHTHNLHQHITEGGPPNYYLATLFGTRKAMAEFAERVKRLRPPGTHETYSMCCTLTRGHKRLASNSVATPSCSMTSPSPSPSPSFTARLP